MKNRVLPAIVAASMFGLTGCQQDAGAFDPPAQADAPVDAVLPASQVKPSVSLGDLPTFFNCVREQGGMVIASHRGGPAPGYPENGLETLEYARLNATPIHEIDVAESRDGVLFLLHDNSLGRTTTGNGQVADTDWDEIANLNLVDNDGKITPFTPPKLSDVLLWAKQTGAVVELDKKRTTSYRNIISHVRAAGAEQNVILISYNDQQAIEIARLAPDLMMTASVNSPEHQAELEAAGVDMTKVIAWTGTSNPNDRAWAALGRRGIESAFGTLGRPGDRLDDTYIADGDLSEFQALADGGLHLLATDEVYAVADYLSADEIALERCGVK
ncbi:MAG: glycerophosphodiester phosphodiesterase family protein [Henriciella sp.]|nr:glycerophosphodiester phosphodiesterase family protein [Henriciella sp.]